MMLTDKQTEQIDTLALRFFLLCNPKAAPADMSDSDRDLYWPLAEYAVAELTTRPEPAANAVERAAEAIYVTNQASAIPRDKRWWITPFEELGVDAQERYRDMARAALQAAAAKGTEGGE